MILTELKGYLRQQGQATLADIALHLDSEPEAVRGMLTHWIRKGKVVKQTLTPACGSSCQQCNAATTEIYSWVEGGNQHVCAVTTEHTDNSMIPKPQLTLVSIPDHC